MHSSTNAVATKEVVAPPAGEAVDFAASRFAQALASAPGDLCVCLTGGDDAKLIYEQISRSWARAIPWDRTDWFWSDERFVIASDRESNQRMVRKALLTPARVPQTKIHPIDVEGCASAEQAAERYESQIADLRERRRAAGRPLFDFVLHGVGPDGHTAALFPGREEAKADAQRLVVAVMVPGYAPFIPRVSLTLAALNDSAAAMAFAFDPKKREAVRTLLEGGDTPAARVTSHGPMTFAFEQEMAALDEKAARR